VVEVLIEQGNIVAFVDDLLAWWNSGRQQKSLRLESSAQFFD
jgi:hypothetical protein